MTPNATLIGSIGVALLLAAFVLNLAKRLPENAPIYASMNVVGAGLACYSSYLISFMPFVVLEGAWMLAALFALARSLGRSAANAR